MYLVYLFLLVSSFIWLRLKFTLKSEHILILFWFVIFVYLGTYAYFTDDYESYAEVVNAAYINPLAIFSIEPFWIWLADYTKGNIDSYRFIVFFLIAIILFFIHKAACVKLKYLIIYYTFFCLLAQITSIRQALNMMLCLYGTLLCYNKHRIIGIIFILLSCYFHKSGIIFALLLPLGWLPVSKKIFWTYLLISPLLGFAFYAVLNTSTTFLPLLFLQNYAEKEAEYGNRHVAMQLLSNISGICNFSLVVLTILYFHNTSDRLVKLLTRYLFGLSLMYVFFFLLPMETNVIYKRLLWFGLLIMVIIWSKCIQRELMTRRYIYMLLLFLTSATISALTMIGNNYWRVDILTKFP